MRILITGATGFIGLSLLRAWRNQHDVIGLTRGRAEIDGVEWLTADLTHLSTWSSLPTHVDVVIHLAQSRYYRDFPAQATDIFSVNVQSTMALLDYARRVGARQFILASTGGVYTSSIAPLSETAEVNPSNFYLTSKYAAELLAASYRQFLDVTVVRLFSPYGPEQVSSMMIPRLFSQVRQNIPVRIQGKPGLRINPVFVHDVVRAMDAVMIKPTIPMLNIAGIEEVNLTELVQIMGCVLDRKPCIEYDAIDSQPINLVGDIHLLCDEMGAAPLVSLREGLSSLI
jgi:nucleoside-diphosphate-sugar epimerase